MEPDLASPPDTREYDRLRAIYRRWKRAKGLRGTSSFYRRLDIPEAGMVQAIFSFFLLIPLDEAVWKLEDTYIRWSSWASLPGDILALLLLASHLANAVVLQIHLSRKTPDEQTWPLWLRALRFLVAGLPLGAFLAGPLWCWFREHRPRWAW